MWAAAAIDDLGGSAFSDGTSSPGGGHHTARLRTVLLPHLVSRFPPNPPLKRTRAWE